MTEQTLAEKILDAYDVRACFVCGLPGLCRHREGRVEAAYIEAQAKKPEPIQLVKKKAAAAYDVRSCFVLEKKKGRPK